MKPSTNFVGTMDAKKSTDEVNFIFTEEQGFKSRAIRNRLLAQWVVEQTGMECERTYINEVIDHDFAKGFSQGEVAKKVHDDLLKHGMDISADELNKKISEFGAKARSEVMS